MCAIAWIDAEGRLTSAPARRSPSSPAARWRGLFGLPPERVRVLCERVGGGFGGKQEMLVEDVAALAALRTGRPVKLEFTREEQFTATTTRHPIAVAVKLGARRDGTLTAIALRAVSNTGAYGNHAGGVLHHGCGESIAVYNIPAKKVDGYAVYTNSVPAGAFRGYGLSQLIFAVESAIDELARSLGLDPVAIRRRNVIRPGDPMVGTSTDQGDVEYGSYGLDQCLDLVEAALAQGPALPAPEGDWATGQGVALAMIHTIPPRGHFADARIALRPDGRLRPHGRHRRIRQRHPPPPMCRSPPGSLSAAPADHRRPAVRHRRRRPRHRRLWLDGARRGRPGRAARRRGAVAARLAAAAEALFGPAEAAWRLEPGGLVDGARRVPLSELAARAGEAGMPLEGTGRFDGTPRSIAFNVQGFRVAVHRVTGAIRILQSVHAADAGDGDQPHAVPRPGRRRRRPGDRRGALRGSRHRRPRAG